MARPGCLLVIKPDLKAHLGHGVAQVISLPWAPPNPLQTGKCSVTLCNPKFFAILSQAELPLTDREMEILNKTAGIFQSPELLPDSADEEVAPPKPPLPGIRVVDNR